MSLDLLMIAADSAKVPAALQMGNPTLQQVQRQQKMQLLLQQQRQQLPNIGMGLMFPGASSSCFVPKVSGQLLHAGAFQPFPSTLLSAQPQQQIQQQLQQQILYMQQQVQHPQQLNLHHSSNVGGAVVAGRSRSGSSSSSADERIMSPASTISDAEAGDLSDSGGTEDSIPQKSQHNVRKYESPPTPVTSAASAASINMEGPGMKRRKLNRPDAEAMLQEKKRRQTQALIQQGHNQQLMANQHHQQQNHEFLNNQLRVHLLQLQQQRRVKQLVSQGSCFVQDKKTKRKRKCDEPLSSLACMSYPMLSSMLAPAQSVQFSPTGLMTGMVPSQVTGAAQGQVTSNNCSKGVVNLSSMLENCVAKSAKQQATMEQQYAMALNNMNAVISMGGNQVKKAETRRREKRRLSAQRRRERKRCTLSYMEEKVCNAKKEDAKLSELLSKHLEQDVDDTTKESRAAIQKVLDGANKAIMEPLFPFWKDILEKARKETMQDDAPQLSDESAMKKALSKDPSEEDKLKIRRERNRISARMSRLRKRLRQNYLEETLDLLSKRIALVKSALHAGGVQVNQSSSE